MSRSKTKIFRKSSNEETVIYNSHAKPTVKGSFIISTTPEKIGVRVMIPEPFLPDNSRASLTIQQMFTYILFSLGLTLTAPGLRTYTLNTCFFPNYSTSVDAGNGSNPLGSKQGKADGTSMNCNTFPQLSCDIHIKGKHNYIAIPGNNTVKSCGFIYQSKARWQKYG